MIVKETAKYHLILCSIKGVTMRAIFSNPAGWKFIDSNGWKKIKFWRKFFFRKIASGQALFPPLVKAKNQHKIFEKHLKQKRCVIRRLNVPNFCYFSKKIQVNMVKNVKKLLQICNFHIINDFEQFLKEKSGPLLQP